MTSQSGLFQTRKKPSRSFRLSLRYKLAFPVLILTILVLFILFRTTFRTVRSVFIERHEARLRAIAEVFAETIKVPLMLRNPQILSAHIEWMSRRADVLAVRVEDTEGVMLSNPDKPTYQPLPRLIAGKNFMGVKRLMQDTYAVAVPIHAYERRLGRVMIIFSQQGLETELRRIFEQRFTVAFIMAFCLAFLIAGITWLAIRPLFILKRTVQEILGGDLTARAQIFSFDEIQDLGEAFNEMVARLAKSLHSLRARTEALEESEAKYRLIIENASDIIFSLTPEGEIALLNKDISGQRREELLMSGLSLLMSLYTPDSRTRFEEALLKVLDTKNAVTNLSIIHLHAESRAEIFYLVNLTPMLDHEHNIKLIQGVMRDITELRRIEMMKESLIRDVAHELKTPTAKFEMAVGWFEKELEKNGEKEKYLEITDILKSNTDRLMRTITSIMDLSKLESGMDKTMPMASVDLREVLEQVHKDMEALCRQKGLLLESSLGSESLMIRGDRDMLYRLFVNLIGNAVKFTPSGEIAVQAGRTNEQVFVTVRDTGIGIGKEDLGKIFGRFFQKTASTVGIGVGLAISRDIVILHQGRIWAESEGLGKGAVFKVEFPGIE